MKTLPVDKSRWMMRCSWRYCTPRITCAITCAAVGSAIAPCASRYLRMSPNLHNSVMMYTWFGLSSASYNCQRSLFTFRSPHLNNIGMTQLPVDVHFLQYSPIADALRRNRTSIHLLDSDGSTRRQLDGAVHGGKRARADHRAELVVLQSRRW